MSELLTLAHEKYAFENIGRWRHRRQPLFLTLTDSRRCFCVRWPYAETGLGVTGCDVSVINSSS